MVADVVDPYVDEAGVSGTLEDSGAERAGKYLREDGEHINTHEAILSQTRAVAGEERAGMREQKFFLSEATQGIDILP
jgi:hypothetical protein